MKKLLGLAMVFALVLGLCACSEVEEVSRYIYMVSHSEGITDQSFNQSAQEGLQLFFSEHSEEGWKTKIIESSTAFEFTQGLNSALEDPVELILTWGSRMLPQYTQFAAANPTHKFAVLDWAEEDAPLDNVAYVRFKEHEGSFLVGMIAGLTTKSNKVGFVGEGNNELTHRYEIGFRTGVHLVNPSAEVLVFHADLGAYNSGYQGANQLIGSGTDVLYHVPGDLSKGVAEACIAQDIWFIGADSDQSYLAPYNTLTSMIKRLDQAVYFVSQDYFKGNFSGGLVTELGIREGGVGYVTSHFLSEETIGVINVKATEVKAGSLIVPYNEEGYIQFITGLLD